MRAGRHRPCGRRREREALRARLRPDERRGVGECVAHRHVVRRIAHAARLELGVVEHLVDQPQQVPLAALDAGQVLPLLLRHRPANPQLHQLGVPADRVEWGAQLVRHHRQELALCAARRLRLRTGGLGFRAGRLRLGARPLALHEQPLHLAPRDHLGRDVAAVRDDARPGAVGSTSGM
jgi:hypothetical protein